MTMRIHCIKCFSSIFNLVRQTQIHQRPLTCFSRGHNFNQKRNIQFTKSVLKINSIKTPNFPESITEGDIRWSVGLGDFVKVDQIIGEIETDKTSLSIVSPFNGIVKELSVLEGSKVTKGQVICHVEESDQPLSIPKTEPKKSMEESTSSVKQTIQEPQGNKKEEKTPKKQAQVELLAHNSEERIETRVPMNRMRQTIAMRLKESQNINAMLTTFNEIDMTYAIALRAKHKDRCLKEFGIKLGFMSIFIRSSVHALKLLPTVNSVVDRTEIISRNFIDISVAVSSPKGLVVPVIRNAEKMNMLQIEQALAELAEKARTNKLVVEDMEGGTFTISNGGVFGSMMSTPIINMPQSAILGMHAIKDRAVVIDGKVEVRPMMYVALTYDHRIIDGREAVTFLGQIKDCVEDPAKILMGF